jgi:hypothetical protein
VTIHLSNPFDEHWRHSLAYPLAGISISSAIGWLTSPAVASVATGLSLLVTAIGGAVMGLVHQVRLQRIKEQMKAVELEMLRRKLRELPPEQLDPQAVADEVDEKTAK